MKTKLGTKFLLALSVMAATSVQAQFSSPGDAERWRDMDGPVYQAFPAPRNHGEALSQLQAVQLVGSSLQSCAVDFLQIVGEAMIFLALDIDAEIFAGEEYLRCTVRANHKSDTDKATIENLRDVFLLSRSERANPVNPFAGTSVNNYAHQAQLSLPIADKLLLQEANKPNPGSTDAEYAEWAATQEIARGIRENILFKMDGLINQQHEIDTEKCEAKYYGFLTCVRNSESYQTRSANN